MKPELKPFSTCSQGFSNDDWDTVWLEPGALKTKVTIEPATASMVGGSNINSFAPSCLTPTLMTCENTVRIIERRMRQETRKHGCLPGYRWPALGRTRGREPVRRWLPGSACGSRKIKGKDKEDQNLRVRVYEVDDDETTSTCWSWTSGCPRHTPLQIRRTARLHVNMNYICSGPGPNG